MTKLINTTGVHTVDYLKGYTKGKFRFVTKCRAGFMTVSDANERSNEYYINHPETLLNGHKKGALYTIEFCPDGGDYYLTVFATKGKTVVLIDETILLDLTVGTINQFWINTNLYSQTQYQAVGAKTWADRAYSITEQLEVAA
jgi:hypothetical protein